MTYTLPNFTTMNSEGVDVTAIYTPYDQTAAISSTNDPSNPGPPFALGTQIIAANGTKWMFVKTTTVITQGMTVAIPNTFVAVAIGGAGAATALPEGTGTQIGFYQNSTSTASGNFFWVALSGNVTVLVASAGITVPLYSLDTAGALTGATNTVSHYQISGITCVVTASGSTASLIACVANSVSVRKPLAGS